MNSQNSSFYNGEWLFDSIKFHYIVGCCHKGCFNVNIDAS